MPIATIQQAITDMLTTRTPEFHRFGSRMFVAFATLLIAWYGIRMMFASREPLQEQIFGWAKLLLFISFGYAMIQFYDAPLPGIGVSFSNLITDQTHYFMNVLEMDSLARTHAHLDELFARFIPPNVYSILANLLYGLLYAVIQLSKAASLAVMAYGLIASAVCALLGPIFIPFFLIPQLDFLFWGWFRAFLTYSFIPVVSMAFLMIFEQFVYRYVATLPPTITPDLYLIYVGQSVAIMLTFITSLALVPALTSSIFSGYALGTSGALVGALSSAVTRK